MNNQFGKLSALRLTAECQGGRTALEDVSFTAPFKIMHPFYEKEDLMTVMLLTASAGIMAGDRQELDIRVREHARMELVSQAYEKIHRMEDGYAVRRIRLKVEPGAVLYYTPLPAIPFAGSDYRCTVEAELADETSQLVFSEILSCGRVAHGEAFLYHRFENKVSIYQGGRIVYRDNACYEPQRMDMRGMGMYEGFTHLANLVICNQPKTDEWMGRVREMIDAQPDMEGGVTRTAAGHAAVRILGRSGEKLTEMTGKILCEKL